MAKQADAMMFPDRMKALLVQLRRHAPHAAEQLVSAQTEREVRDVICQLFDLTSVPTDERAVAFTPENLPLYIAQYIDRNLPKGLTLKTMAQFLGYSEKYCCDFFQSTMGESFSSYLKHRRLESHAPARRHREKHGRNQRRRWDSAINFPSAISSSAQPANRRFTFDCSMAGINAPLHLSYRKGLDDRCTHTRCRCVRPHLAARRIPSYPTSATGMAQMGDGRNRRRLLSGSIILVYIPRPSSLPEVDMVPVRVVGRQALTSPLTTSGYVVAQRQASVASKGTGRLEYLGVTVGSHVKAGDVIARVQQDDVQAAQNQVRARLNIAKAALANAQTELQHAQLSYTRTKALLPNQFVSQAEFDTASTRLRRAEAVVRSSAAAITAAEADVQTADVMLENTLIRAPFEGTVLKKFAEIGEVVAPMAAGRNGKSWRGLTWPRTETLDTFVPPSFSPIVYRASLSTTLATGTRTS